jgi:ABC-2 type transport system ATP-binding protein
LMGFTNAMWTGAELIHQTDEDDMKKVRVRLLGNTSPNQLLQAVMSTAEITGFNEVLPTMNDVFIRKVNETNGEATDVAGTKSNFTE